MLSFHYIFSQCGKCWHVTLVPNLKVFKRFLNVQSGYIKVSSSCSHKSKQEILLIYLHLFCNYGWISGMLHLCFVMEPFSMFTTSPNVIHYWSFISSFTLPASLKLFYQDTGKWTVIKWLLLTKMTFILQGSPLRLKCPFWGRPGQARTSSYRYYTKEQVKKTKSFSCSVF